MNKILNDREKNLTESLKNTEFYLDMPRIPKNIKRISVTVRSTKKISKGTIFNNPEISLRTSKNLLISRVPLESLAIKKSHKIAENQRQYLRIHKNLFELLFDMKKKKEKITRIPRNR